MDYETLLFDLSDGVAHIQFNRPDAYNSLDSKMSIDMMHAMIRCDDDPQIRAVLLSGVGPTFSSGGDIKEFAAVGDDLPRHIKEMVVYFYAAMSRMIRMNSPLVAAIHGSAAGAGFAMACASDLVVAAESAKFTMAYTKVGLTPDGSSTFFVPRVVGMKRAIELALTNRVLSAQEAMEWSIVTKVVPDDSLLDEARALATKLASGPTGAFGQAKRLLYGGWNETLETQMEYESQSISNRARTLDAKEGIEAFIEKRPANYVGD